MKKEYLNAQNEEDLIEIVKAVQNGEDPGDRLKKKAEAEEAARKKAAQEEAAAREAAEKEKAEREAAEKEEAAEKRAARKQEAAERRAVKRAVKEENLYEDKEEQSEGKTQRRYGAGSVSDKAETVGNRILRSLHMEHLEEPPSEEAVEALIKDLPKKDDDESGEKTADKAKEEETMTEIDGTKVETDDESPEEANGITTEEREEDEELAREEKTALKDNEESPAKDETSIKEEETDIQKAKSSEEKDTEKSGEETLKEMKSGTEEEIEGETFEESAKEPNEEIKEEDSEEPESLEKAGEEIEEESEEKSEEETDKESEEVKPVRTKRANSGGKMGMLIATGVIVIGMAALAVGSGLSGSGQGTDEEPETEEAQAADLEDAEPPVLSAVNSGGIITLNASDDDSGVDTIWYAVVEDGSLSDLPQYEVYEEPITYIDGNTYYFYAVDQAGNQSELISIPE